MTTVVYDTQCEIPSHTGPILRPVSMNGTNSFLSSVLIDFYFQTPSHSAALPQLQPSRLSRPSLIQACSSALPLVKPGGPIPASFKGANIESSSELMNPFHPSFLLNIFLQDRHTCELGVREVSEAFVFPVIT